LVEAIPELAAALQRQWESRPGVAVVAAALSDRNGRATFELNRSSASSSLLKIDRRNAEWFGMDLGVATTVEVPTLTLAELMTAQGTHVARLAEAGSARCRAPGPDRQRGVLPQVRVIYTEVFFEPLYEGAWLFWDMNEFLAARGFKLCGITNIVHARNGELLQANAIFRQREL
jgi:hypothetical protein